MLPLLLIGVFLLMQGPASKAATAPPQTSTPTTSPDEKTGQVIADVNAAVKAAASWIQQFKDLMSK